jgi:hypothetical protein
MDMSTRKKKRRIISAILGGIILIAVIAYAVTYVISGGDLDISGLIGSADDDVSEFYLGASSSSAFCAMEGGLAAANTTDVTFTSSTGEETVRENVIFSAPAIATGGKLAVAYDLGAASFVVFNKSGVLLNTEAEGNIIDVSVNSSGWFAVSTQDSGSKGTVTVYNDDAQAVYRWYSNEGYLVSAEVSPDNGSMTAITVLSGGSRVVGYSLSSTEVQWEYIISDAVAMSVRYMTSSKIAVICDNRCVTVNSKGEELNTYNYEGRYLRAFADGSRKFTALLLSDYQVGSSYRLVTINESGEMITEAATDMQVTDMTSSGDSLAMLYSNAFAVYDQKLEPQNQRGGISGATGILARNGGTAIVIYSHTAEIY